MIVENEGLEDLIEGWRAGTVHEDALLAILRELVEFTYGFYRAEFEGEHADLVQEGLVKLWKELPGWTRSKGTAFAWCQRVSQNRMRDVSRVNRRRRRGLAKFIAAISDDPVIHRQHIRC